MATQTKAAAKTAPAIPNLPVRSEQPSVILKGEGGQTSIEPHVVAKIAGLAIREVSGVHALVPFGATQALANLTNSIRGKDYRDLGVSVEVGQVEAAVDTRIITDYGVSIPAVAANIRENVEARILEMTGLTVKEVNIAVVDLWFEEVGTLPPVVQTPSRVQ